MNAYLAFALGMLAGPLLMAAASDVRECRRLAKEEYARARILAEEAGVGWGVWTPMWRLKRRIDAALEMMGPEERKRVIDHAIRRVRPPPCRPVDE